MTDIGSRSLNTMIICKSAQRRSLLQKGISGSAAFDIVRQSITTQDALTKMAMEAMWHLVFISPEFTRNDVISFLNQMRERPSSADAATILLMDSRGERQDAIDQNEWRESGVDLFLMAPYTIDEFEQITEDAITVVHRKRSLRLSGRIKDFVKRLLAQLNLVALQKRSGSPELEKNIEKLNELTEAIQYFTPDERALYMSIMIEMTTDAARAERAGVYNGASARLRRKYQKRLSLELSDA